MAPPAPLPRAPWPRGALSSYLMIILTLLLGGALRGPRRAAAENPRRGPQALGPHAVGPRPGATGPVE